MNTSKSIINLGLILISLFGIGSNCLASPTESTHLKIGIINTKSLESCLYAKDIQQKLEKEFNPRGEKFQAKKQEFQNKQDLFQRDKAILSEKERIAKERELTKLQQEAQHMFENLGTEFKSRQEELQVSFNKIVDDIVSKFAKQEKYDLVLPDQVILYSNDVLDCTDKIVNLLDAQFKAKK